MARIENGKTDLKNIWEVDWVQQQVAEELSTLNKNVNDVDGFYKKEGEKATFMKETVISYLDSIKDWTPEQLKGQADVDGKRRKTAAWIMAVQIALGYLGYDAGRIDGIYRSIAQKSAGVPSKTTNAVKEFQEKNDLTERDGFPGSETIQKLLELLKENDDSGEGEKVMTDKEKLDEVRGKDGVEVEVGGEVKAEDLVEGVTDGVIVSIESGVDTSKIGEIEVTVKVVVGEKEKKDIKVTVKVVEKREGKETGEESEEEKILNNVTLKDEIVLGEGEVEARDLLNGLPDEGEAEFVGGKGIDKEKEGEQEVEIRITLGEGDKKVERIIKVVIEISTSKVLKIREGKETDEESEEEKFERLCGEPSLTTEQVRRLVKYAIEKKSGVLYLSVEKLNNDQVVELGKLKALTLYNLVTMEKGWSIEFGKIQTLELNGLIELDDDNIDELGNVQSLSLNSLTKLTVKQATELGKVKKLSLDGLEELGEEQAVELGKVRELSLGKGEVLIRLTKEEAIALGNVKKLSLDSLTELGKEQAEALQSVEELSLWGIESLTNEEVDALSKVKVLSVNGLASLTVYQAEGFRNVDELNLNGLNSLSSEVVDKIGKLAHKPNKVSLDGLDSLSKEQASALKGVNELSLGGLDELHDDVLGVLLGEDSNVEKLNLDGLKGLTDYQSEILGVRVRELSLNSLENIEIEWATNLGNIQNLSLDSIGILPSDEVLDKLLSVQELSLMGLESLSDEQAEKLANVGVLHIDERILTDKQKEILKESLKNGGLIDYSNVEDLSEEDYNSLCEKEKLEDEEIIKLVKYSNINCGGYLSLNKLTTLSDNQAVLLGDVKELSLDGLSEFEDGQMLVGLGKVKKLSVGLLETLTVEQAAELGKVRELNVMGLKTLGIDQAEELSNVRILHIYEENLSEDEKNILKNVLEGDNLDEGGKGVNNPDEGGDGVDNPDEGGDVAPEGVGIEEQIKSEESGIKGEYEALGELQKQSFLNGLFSIEKDGYKYRVEYGRGYMGQSLVREKETKVPELPIKEIFRNGKWEDYKIIPDKGGDVVPEGVEIEEQVKSEKSGIKGEYEALGELQKQSFLNGLFSIEKDGYKYRVEYGRGYMGQSLVREKETKVPELPIKEIFRNGKWEVYG